MCSAGIGRSRDDLEARKWSEAVIEKVLAILPIARQHLNEAA